MAEQCIVCLEDLDHAPPNLDVADPSLVIAENDLGGTPTTTTAAQQHNDANTQHNTASGQLNIAVIQSCSHVLHDVCLREWTQKANSCPICRTQFNKVEVRETTAGPVIREYEVKDKKQIAEFDPLAWIQEQEQEEVIERPCPICLSQEDEAQLLLCDACDAPYHTYCLDPPLDHVPAGHWYCMECRHEEGNSRNAAEDEPARPAATAARRNRTLAQYRQSRSRGRVRANAWDGAWNQITARVHEATGIDFDFDGQDDLQEYRHAQSAHNRTAQQQRELREWEQRIRIAQRQGAGDVFRENISGRSVPAYHAPAPPPQETEAERRAWATYERERLRQEQRSAGASPGRKRKATDSPREPQAQEPERKLKRPRTRRNRPQENAGSSSEHNNEPARPVVNGRAASQTSTPRRSPPRTAPVAAAPAPSFLSSLLKEVEESAKGDHGDSDTPHTNGTSPGIEHSSPILSPSTSNYSTPRPLSLTPPPRRSGSPRQTSLSSIVEPIYPIPNPSDYSPNRPTPQRNDLAHRAAERVAGSSPSPGTPPPLSSTLRHPQPQRSGPHLALASPSSPQSPSCPSQISDEEASKRREGVRVMVKKALDAKWRSVLSSEQYTTVNRKVSRKLYERVPDLRDVSGEVKERWEGIAGRECEACVRALGYAQTGSQGGGMGGASGLAGPGKGQGVDENRKAQTPREGVTA